MSNRRGFDVPGAPLSGRYSTVREAFAAAAEDFGDRPAVVMPGDAEPLTFRGWHEASSRLAAHLQRLGVEPGDVVALALPPGRDYAIGFGAVIQLSAVTTGINGRLGPREVAAIFAKCQPRIVLGNDLPVSEAPGTATTFVDRAEMTSALSGPPLGGADAGGEPHDPAIIVWTSGTTGTPKGAWFDHANLAAVARMSGVMSEPFDRRMQPASWALAAYMTKLWDQLAWAITLVGIPLPWDPTTYLEVLQDERVSVAAAVPTQWEKLVGHPAVNRRRLASIRVGISSSAPISPRVVAEVYERMGFPLVCRYALTESPVATGTSPGDPPGVLSETVGRPQTGVELRLAATTGDSAADGVGVVKLHSDAIMRGYWGEPELTKEVLAPDGWLSTGDLGRLDAAGNLILVGRMTDMYIRGGYNVYPSEVEGVLATHPDVSQVAVAGLPAPVIGEIGVAFVVPAVGRAVPTLDDLRRWCGERLADYKRPDELRIVPALPLTAALKVDKRALRRDEVGLA
jgi:acyl-CoA synthetase (AMP-forming)/AMP-acid ligase II